MRNNRKEDRAKKFFYEIAAEDFINARPKAARAV